MSGCKSFLILIFTPEENEDKMVFMYSDAVESNGDNKLQGCLSLAWYYYMSVAFTHWRWREYSFPFLYSRKKKQDYYCFHQYSEGGKC